MINNPYTKHHHNSLQLNMHNFQTILNATRNLTIVIKWLNCKSVTEFHLHSEQRYGTFIVMASVCILFEDLFNLYKNNI